MCTSIGGASISIDSALNNKHSTVPCLCKQPINAYTVRLTTSWKKELPIRSMVRLLYENPFYKTFSHQSCHYFLSKLTTKNYRMNQITINKYLLLCPAAKHNIPESTCFVDH